MASNTHIDEFPQPIAKSHIKTGKKIFTFSERENRQRVKNGRSSLLQYEETKHELQHHLNMSSSISHIEIKANATINYSFVIGATRKIKPGVTHPDICEWADRNQH
jgi:hypothetical protein